jgi:hypothetical protein
MAQDILITPGSGEPQILFRGSGAIDTAVELNVMSSYQSATGSGTALLYEGTEGLLFGITDNLSSGTIFSVSDITGLPIIEVDASGDLKLAEFGRDIIAYQPITIESGVPSTTTNKLYNDAGTLKFNGSAIGGGGSYTAGSGLTLAGTEFNVYGGSGHFIDLKLETSGTGDLLTLTSTEDGSDAAPVISTMRDSASPADGDYLGQLKFKGRSDTGTERVYAKITGKTLDVTNGTEDGLIEIAVISNGSQEIISRIRNDGWRIVNDNNLYIQDNGSLGVRVDPTYSLHVKDDAYIGSGVTLPDVVPAVTTNKLYNNGGTLTFNGSAVGGGGTYTAGSGLTLQGTEFNVYGGSGHFVSITLESGVPSDTTDKLYNDGYFPKFNGSGIPISHPITDASGVHNMMVLSQATYDAIGTKDPNTLYFIT